MSDVMISFVMPAKNAAGYVSDAISILLDAPFKDWELIVVEDHSCDDTLGILNKLAGQDARVTVVRNTGSGKIAGLNYGYSLAHGRIIKCIDADDQLRPEFFDHIDTMSQCDAMCHDMCVTAGDLSVRGRYAMDQSFFQCGFEYCLRYLKSLPRCTWSFTRELGDRIFPMPAELPFEDVWFSLVIKRYATKISYISEGLYYYRQHEEQTFGGVLSFSDPVVVFRAQRMLRLLEVIESDKGADLRQGVAANGFFDEIRQFYRLLSQPRVSSKSILGSAMPASFKAKVFIYKKLSRLAPYTVRLKWLLDRVR